MTENTFSRTNPFLATIKERMRLSKDGSKKNTHHIVLNIEGSNLNYLVGDSIGIYPSNDPTLVELTLKALNATGNEIVKDKNGENPCFLKDFFTTKANITEISKKLLLEISKKQTNPQKLEFLSHLLLDENKEELKAYLASHELWDTLEENKEVIFEIQELALLLMPLLPRLYSISSSQKSVGNEIHLTVAMLEYESNQLLRKGVCTHFLCNLAAIHETKIPVYIQPSHGFTLPTNHESPMIMVGPGTGVAPFRAFMQERVHMKAKGKNWLIFGEWNKKFDFFYEDYWKDLETKDHLRVSAAFSRDQEEKVYVQHRMKEQGEEIFNWLQNGAHFYICGDAKKMARDVESTLLDIIKQFGNKDDMEAKAYLKELRQEKRYLKDVY